MTRRIKTKVYGEEYTFKLTMTWGSKKCTMRLLCYDEELPAYIEDNHIVLEKPIVLEGYSPDLTPPKEKTVGKIKIPRDFKGEVVRYANGQE